ncbi:MULTISPECIES: SDR family oxidoreductase [Paraburkholderia]|jgi:NAD(P)-dependent dehydrogenase (short-subunit alcohol dehydrogenase family)|uniref:SDR family oxidoreductase n=1 Tax=Paraburkholderia caribensis TaxID=75105 RepID=A0A9Q6S600_9BURK|nr:MULTISPECIES: SDR family oxidoreductase [Paraburkholderia]ALP65741.1 short-chain dehydrogenase [Paraburkholderia caribensis]AMV46330.1 short-chain dehydrogenase [Paraburkholderia caribensis]AUT55334.1 short-chain dehydrogenase [Paraburkholderia caribensis]MCO4876113.1 SDR family oxidoreductase [Paraburkholderia caribensis]PTB29489.1 KR domain-containing protein [Paraburkholderia caribensis]
MSTHDDPRQFDGKTVLVTGAGKGIGRATVQLLARRGARVIALSRSAADLRTLEDETGCTTLCADLGDAGAARGAAEAAQPVDLLVNCAGIVELQPFLDTSVEAFDTIMAVNVRAAMIVAQQCARSMIGRGVSGSIVNVSSLSATVGLPLHAAYCASKAALDGLTRVMAVELGPHGIRVNTVNPVVTLTPMAEKAWSDPAKSAPMLARIPLKRFVQPLEVARTIAYLLSDESAMVSGVSLAVDGGFQAG